MIGASSFAKLGLAAAWKKKDIDLELTDVEQRWLKIIYNDLVQDVEFRFASSVFSSPENGAMLYFSMPRLQRVLHCWVPSILPEEFEIYPKREALLYDLGFKRRAGLSSYHQTIKINSPEDLNVAAYLAFRTLKDVWAVRDFSWPEHSRDWLEGISGYHNNPNYEIHSELPCSHPAYASWSDEQLYRAKEFDGSDQFWWDCSNTF